MWRNSFLNLCFIILVISVLALQHSAAPFAPGHGSALTGEWWRNLASSSDDESFSSLRPPAALDHIVTFLRNNWRRGVVLREWLLEYNTSQWEMFKSSNRAESDLLEARFHVANAEVFTEAISEKARAVNELGRAEIALEAAQTLAPRLAPQLKAVENEITAAEKSEGANRALVKVPFETIKSDLDQLIGSVRAS